MSDDDDVMWFFSIPQHKEILKFCEHWTSTTDQQLFYLNKHIEEHALP